MHALSVPERVIVAPSVGVFHPLVDGPDPDGQFVHIGQSIGVIESRGLATPVRSPFRGHLVGMLAIEGERIREGEPVAWLRTNPS
jgi:biotin carboxyl carrier protein